MEYIINTETQQIISNDTGQWPNKYVESSSSFSGPVVFKTPWREATQGEIDAYLLPRAKDLKITELKGDLNNFLIAGYQYDGNITCPTWVTETTYVIKELVVGSDSINYKSLADDNTGHDPISSPSWWEEFEPVFKMDNAAMVNITAKCKLDSGAPDRYKFYAKGDDSGFRHQIDFNNVTDWEDFVEAIALEEDRVMRKYNDYRTQIAECQTVAAVEAITIDFTE